MLREAGIGEALHAHARALFPVLRSITGPGLRETLDYIGRHIPLHVTEVPSGTAVLDWVVPEEWTLRDARIETLGGETVVDVRDHSLHVLNYSEAVDRVVSRAELQAHLHSLPEAPDLIPYRTSYYAQNWGFCLPHRLRERLGDDAYRVRIDATLAPGSLSYGECVLPGTSAEEVLFSCHCCHPSLANDNLAALSVALELARGLMARPRRMTYRFVFAPGTIGAIAWLAGNGAAVARLRHGLVLACLGDAAAPSYKRSRGGGAAIDRYASHVLRQRGSGARIRDFVPFGYDERQYGSPGFDLPVGCLMRSAPGEYPEYHSSADDLAFIRPEAMADSLAVLTEIVDLIEQDGCWRNMRPFGEPQLGRRGLYAPIGGARLGEGADPTDMLWVLNFSDGAHSLLDIAERAGRPFGGMAQAARVLAEAGLLEAGAG